ncbi:MAG: dTDP-4-dehydrorhamnose 3,5-epimerase [Candidatus Omnitrophota bacterium]|jgi:dTDP-4-dehydrorhamnose 3,5-epimerase
MVNGVLVEKLKILQDERGKVMRMMRCDSPYFSKFGEIYFSTVNSGAVKAWKKHLKMTQYFAVPVGKIALVIYDDRAQSSSQGVCMELEIGEDNYCLVKIPALLWYGFKGTAEIPSLIANCADIPHDPDEIIRTEPSDKRIPYTWK